MGRVRDVQDLRAGRIAHGDTVEDVLEGAPDRPAGDVRDLCRRDKLHLVRHAHRVEGVRLERLDEGRADEELCRRPVDARARVRIDRGKHHHERGNHEDQPLVAADLAHEFPDVDRRLGGGRAKLPRCGGHPIMIPSSVLGVDRRSSRLRCPGLEGSR